MYFQILLAIVALFIFFSVLYKYVINNRSIYPKDREKLLMWRPKCYSPICFYGDVFTITNCGATLTYNIRRSSGSDPRTVNVLVEPESSNFTKKTVYDPYRYVCHITFKAKDDTIGGQKTRSFFTQLPDNSSWWCRRNNRSIFHHCYTHTVRITAISFEDMLSKLDQIKLCHYKRRDISWD